MGVKFYAPGSKNYDKWKIAKGQDLLSYMARTGEYRNDAKIQEDKN